MLSKIQKALYEYKRKKHGEFGLGYIVSTKQLQQLKTKLNAADSYCEGKSSGVQVDACPQVPGEFRSAFPYVNDVLGVDMIAKAHN